MRQRPPADTPHAETGVDALGIAPTFSANCRVDGDGRAIVEVIGDIDLASRDQLWTVIEEALGTGGALVIDLAGATFVDSIGLNLILRANKERPADSEQVTLRSPSDAVCKLLRITGVDSVVTVESAQPAA